MMIVASTCVTVHSLQGPGFIDVDLLLEPQWKPRQLSCMHRTPNSKPDLYLSTRSKSLIGIRYLQRIGVGLVLSTISISISGIVETRRKSMACQHDVVDSLQPLPMSVFWLGYEYAILSYEFKLERFLTTHKDLDVGRGEYFELILFDFGRKGYFGLQMVHLTLASFLQAFDISTPSNAVIDMIEEARSENGQLQTDYQGL
ncbi:hypothetical protein Golax_008262 [Gossypium laxum]|uniref:Uncharacterized protein n=1 Tax=Gossypium laxum TaxID=34288 RepID=A0A7J9A9J2_9ROSI|nr:hypothetical protein [Gossypium laxum]